MSEISERTRATRRTRRLAAVGGAYAAGFVALYFAAVRTPLGQLVDASTLGVLGWMRSEAWLAFYDGRDIVLYGVLAAAVVAALATILDHDWKPAVYSALLVGTVAVASVALKELLPRPNLGDFAYAENTFPSGHTAITLAASVAIIWCAPRWFSPVLVAVLGVLASFVAVGSVLSAAHRASDTLAGALLAGAVSCGLAAVARVAAPAASRVRRGVMIGAVIALATAFLYLLAALGIFGDADHAAQLGVAIVLGPLGVVVSVLAVHRPFRSTAAAPPPRFSDAVRDEGL